MKIRINIFVTTLWFFCLWITVNAQTTNSLPKTIPLSLEIEKKISAVVAIYSTNPNDKPQLIGYGFFVNPWSVVTSNRLVQESIQSGATRMALVSIDGKFQYTPLQLSVVDNNSDFLKIEVREKSPTIVSISEKSNFKNGDTIYLLRPKAGANVLVEVPTPLPKEHRGEPLFDANGQVLGMGIDPSVKFFAKSGMLPAKEFKDFAKLYSSAYQNGKLSCPSSGDYCHIVPADHPMHKAMEQNIHRMKPYVEKSFDELLGQNIKDDTGNKLSGFVLGRVIRTVQPHYPSEAKAKGITGSVQVRVVIDEKGEIVVAQTISGPEVFRQGVLEVARQWVYEPFTLQSKAVKTTGVLTFNFTLR